MKTLDTRRQYWQDHVSAWRRSGLSRVAYCRGHGLLPRQLGYWVRRDGEDVHDVRFNALTLVPVKVQPARSDALVLQNNQGWQLTLPVTISTEWLSSLMRGLS